jgi:Cu-processing system permease protein
MTHMRTLARLECLTVVRLKWVRLLTAAFALLAAASAYSAGAATDLSGADGFGRTTMALIPVALVLIPLAALVLGICGQSVEPGSEPFLFTQPIGRVSVLVGRWLGEVVALSGSIGIGFGVGGAIVAFGSGRADALSFAFFVFASIALGAIFLSIAAAIACATEKRVTAIGIGIFAWFLFVLLYDGAALSLAGWLTGSFGGRVLFVSVFGNPVDLIRVVMLLVSGTPHVLGAAGESWMRLLGGSVQTAVLAGCALALWMAAPLAAAMRAISVRDL